LFVQAATKVVAEAEKRKREKKEAVVMAVAKARDDRRALQDSGKQAQLRSGTAMRFLLCKIPHNSLETIIFILCTGSLQFLMREFLTCCSSSYLWHY